MLYPQFSRLFADERTKEVIEKTMECVRDIADEMGPAGLENHLELIMKSVEDLLDKTAFC